MCATGAPDNLEAFGPAIVYTFLPEACDRCTAHFEEDGVPRVDPRPVSVVCDDCWRYVEISPGGCAIYDRCWTGERLPQRMWGVRCLECNTERRPPNRPRPEHTVHDLMGLRPYDAIAMVGHAEHLKRCLVNLKLGGDAAHDRWFYATVAAHRKLMRRYRRGFMCAEVGTLVVLVTEWIMMNH